MSGFSFSRSVYGFAFCVSISGVFDLRKSSECFFPIYQLFKPQFQTSTKLFLTHHFLIYLLTFIFVWQSGDVDNRDKILDSWSILNPEISGSNFALLLFKCFVF